MPRATLSRAHLLAQLPGLPATPTLAERLFPSKAEIAAETGDELVVETTADRLDLLSEEGLALHLQGSAGLAKGLRHLPAIANLDPAPSILCDPSTAALRPFIAGLVVRSPEATGIRQEHLDAAIRFQELLHATIGGDRRAASLGVYPYDRLQPPFTYQVERLNAVSFTPIDGSNEVGAAEFLRSNDLARRYGALGASEGTILTLRDTKGTLLSVPPIANARPGGEVRAGDRTLLIESTGTRSARVADALGLLSVVFAAQGWSSAPVEIRYADHVEDGRAIVAPRSVRLTEGGLTKLSGRAYSASEVEHLLSTSRLSARSSPGGWMVGVPPWRPDILAEVDLAEEVILARGVRPEDGQIPPSVTRGRRRPESRYHRRVAEYLLGLGATELHTPVLVPERLVGLLGRTSAIELAHPVSDQFQRMRDVLSLSLLLALEHNVRSGYPQRFFEVGPVVERDRTAETGATSRMHSGAVWAEDRAGFADGASLVDYILSTFGAAGVREPVEIPGTIPGRSARLRVAGEAVAEMGEIAPTILDALRIPVPVVWWEIDLDRLWPLVRRSETA
ncbi:MAG: hypothetical protein L3J93_01930 [Thermoplasmata archaeon]|nr:hypothetical protein [Thermoplasmata archaeon]